MEQSGASRETVTSLLVSAEADHEDVWDRLLPLVYEEFRVLARRQLARADANATLATTDLVHEAYLRLVDGTRVMANGRRYFFGAAARAMRQVLVDHARRRRRDKRGGGARVLSLGAAQLLAEPAEERLIELDGALKQLATVYPRAVRVVECRFFAGLTVEETCEVLGIAPRTVKRDWALARAWLQRELEGDEA
jgi:RNA polymerase sigma-70 factor (ECF subfamily)